MSTLSVSNITDGTATVGTSYVVNGSAKAWVSINHNSGTPSIQSGSLNISSITDSNTGLVTVTNISAFSGVEGYVVMAQGWAVNTWVGASTSTRKLSASTSYLLKHENGTWTDAFSSTEQPLSGLYAGDLA